MPSPPTRPATISELATAAAETSSSNSNGDLKNLLRRTEGYRRTGGVYMARTTGGSSGAATSTDIGLDLERAFIEYARAATLIVETVPAHREYNTGLNAEQRANLKANGEDILQHLGRLKAALVERYERYMRSGAAREDAVPAFMAAQQLKNSNPPAPAQPTRKASLATHARAAQVVADEAAQWRAQREEAAVRDAGVGYDRMSVASSPAYTSSASASAYASSSSASAFASASNFNPASRTGGYGAGAPTPTYLSSASQSAVAAAARAAAAPVPVAVPVSLGRSSSSGTGTGAAPATLPASFAGASSGSGSGGGGGGGGGGGAYGAYPSSAGVSFPQPHRSASLQAPSAGSYAGAGGGGGGGKGGSPTSYTSTYMTPSGAASYSSYASTTNPPSSYTSTSTAPSSYTSPTPSNYTSASASAHNTPAPGPMPLRPPFANSAEWEWESGESTDEERPHARISYPTTGTGTGTGTGMPFPSPQGHGQYGGGYGGGGGGGGGSGYGEGGKGQGGQGQGQRQGQGPDELSARMGGMNVGTGDGRIDGLPSSSSHSYGTVAYPALARHMSSHQRTQGYVPGAWGSALPPAVPAFAVPPGATPAFPPYAQEQRQGPGQGQGQAQAQDAGNFAGVGAQTALGAARTAAAAPTMGNVGYSTPFSPPVDARAARADAAAQARARDLEAARDAERVAREAEAREREEDAEKEERRRNGGKPRLRTVLLPHATLPRFLAIASGNTARNLETCGLLLGREVVKGSDPTTPNAKTRYVVSTLLIPKQHATSDTCTMDEEEGVLGFTEERGLITLGWIHTHPSQSCFMSSVDLHTHASFQCMLPESFAVVCAPKSDPSFGIFRLTDPPGLQTVLKCTAKQAFHPHPDVPIYTDADKGHVQMRDAALEIVDLR